MMFNIPGVFVLLIQTLYPLQFGARDQDCILAKWTGTFVRWINGLRMGWRTLPGQCYGNPDIARSVFRIFSDSTTRPRSFGRGEGGGVGLKRKTGWARPRGVEQTLSDMPDVDIEHSEDNGRGHPFTNTAVPRFDGTGCWQQHILIFQAIVKSNGWSPVTVALQLFAHLDGEALNVALLMPVKERAMERPIEWYFGIL